MAELIPVLNDMSYLDKIPANIAGFIHNRFDELKTKTGIKRCKYVLFMMYEAYFNAIIIKDTTLLTTESKKLAKLCSEQYKFWNN